MYHAINEKREMTRDGRKEIKKNQKVQKKQNKKTKNKKKQTKKKKQLQILANIGSGHHQINEDKGKK